MQNKTVRTIMRPRKSPRSVILIIVGLLAMLTTAGFSSPAPADERKVIVPPSELPSAIRDAIAKALPKGEIVRVQKEVEGKDQGQYDVDVRAEGKLYEVEVSPDGEVQEVKEVAVLEEVSGSAKKEKEWTKSFNLKNCTFSTLGKNPFFILRPGHRIVLESKREKVVITVLDETKKIGDIETRIVEEREWEDGELKEVSRNFFAQCREHGDVFYFGEEVDDYKDGKIVRHSGAWRADEKDSQAGIIMPGTCLLGARHYQEVAPNALDRAEIVANDVTLKTPAGTFEHCLKVEETSGLDPNERYYKIYAPGVGLIQDEDLFLTSWSKPKK